MRKRRSGIDGTREKKIRISLKEKETNESNVFVDK